MHNLSTRKAVFAGGFFVMILLAPYIILGEDAFITIHDFLDSNPVHANTIISLGLIGDPDGILPILDGVPSLNYISLIPIDIKTILYMLFPMYWAIVINLFFVKFMAFLGMFLLCSHYVLKDNIIYSLIVAILFCLIPFYADYGLSSAGVPLFLYSVFNIENKKKLYLSYILIVFFSCNSSLPLVGLFLCGIWGVWVVYKRIQKDKVYRLHLLGLFIMCIVYLFVNLSIIYNYFFPTDIISHRVEFAQSSTILEDILSVIQLYFYSQYHAGSFPAIVFIATSICVYLLYAKGKGDMCFRKLCMVCFSIMILIMVGTMIKHIPGKLLPSFQFDRFYFLYPTICMILFARSLYYIQEKKLIVFIITFVLVLITVKYDRETIQNSRRLIGLEITQPTFKQYFDTPLFARIKRDLGVNNDYSKKVISLGMHPTIAEYNHFYTLDSYVFNYSLNYKHKFRRVIKNELNKNKTLRDYFDDWGSRCYVFSDELYKKNNQFLCSKKDDFSVKEIDIDTNVLKEFGCEYIFSSVNIENFKELNLEYVNSYSTVDSFWNIRVYKII